jgi:hypothetical protein
MKMSHILKKSLKNIHMFRHKDLTTELKKRRLTPRSIVAGTTRKRKRERCLPTFQPEVLQRPCTLGDRGLLQVPTPPL